MAQDFREYVFSRNLHLSDLAEKAGLKNITMLSAWQRGTVLLPQSKKVKPVADALDIPVERLYALIRESYYRAHPDQRPPETTGNPLMRRKAA